MPTSICSACRSTGHFVSLPTPTSICSTCRDPRATLPCHPEAAICGSTCQPDFGEATPCHPDSAAQVPALPYFANLAGPALPRQPPPKFRVPTPSAKPNCVAHTQPPPEYNPLSYMHATEAFSRMGVGVSGLKKWKKFWGIQGINYIFPECVRIDVYQQIVDLDLEQASMMGTKNIRKLEAFIAGQEYVRWPGDPKDVEDDYD
ncbi:hypothetical protein B0H10DRAFT_1950097 [Mycena sp. CBHHK59/15]|nr:hypothetical protein B0H10DRAFT_1950097 [Mycena sp. CBHHK59/15]